ncbi:MAG: hypothetical protein ACKOXZ_11230, partial [Polynucleobacter victoriensis]
VEQFKQSATSAQVLLEAKEIQKLAQSNSDSSDAFDLIINATASGLGDASPISKELLKAISNSKTLAYDMVYGKETRFMQDARELAWNAQRRRQEVGKVKQPCPYELKKRRLTKQEIIDCEKM